MSDPNEEILSMSDPNEEILSMSDPNEEILSMSDPNEEILSIMKILGSGITPPSGKTLRFNPKTQKLEQRDALDPKTKQIVKKYATPDDPDVLPEIDPTDAIVFWWLGA